MERTKTSQEQMGAIRGRDEGGMGTRGTEWSPQTPDQWQQPDLMN